jgi:hypothetical protein
VLRLSTSGYGILFSSGTCCAESIDKAALRGASTNHAAGVFGINIGFAKRELVAECDGERNAVGHRDSEISSTNHCNTPFVCNDLRTTGSNSFYTPPKNTFEISSLDLICQAGVTHQSAEGGRGINPAPATGSGFWYGSYRGSAHLRCSLRDLGLLCHTENPVTDDTWNKGASMNSPLMSMVSGLFALTWVLRGRFKLLSGRS